MVQAAIVPQIGFAAPAVGVEVRTPGRLVTVRHCTAGSVVATGGARAVCRAGCNLCFALCGDQSNQARAREQDTHEILWLVA
jgi:hypothetical protein